MDSFSPFPELLYSLSEEQVEQVLKSLVVQYNNGTLEPGQAMAGIAQIAALRSLPAALTRRIKRETNGTAIRRPE